MLTLVIGAAASGKSAWAEEHTLSLPGRRVYLATMEPFGSQAAQRIQRHRLLRAGKGFETVERYVDLAGLELPEGCNVLLECLGNLLANELYWPDGGGAQAALEGVQALRRRCRHLTVVSNEIASGGADYLGDTPAYMAQLGRLHRLLAQQADMVTEVVCGVGNILKKPAAYKNYVCGI